MSKGKETPPQNRPVATPPYDNAQDCREIIRAHYLLDEADVVRSLIEIAYAMKLLLQ